ncbi:MAG: LysR family transcriptional regulator, partial [Candidatus Cryptobacteroides sp.]
MFEDFRLKVFMSVAESGSFTAAARTLGVSQPAVSQNISALEKELGVQLFRRSKGEVSLTGEGTAFREYAGRILYWYSVTGDMFGLEGRLSPGRVVRIAADPVAAAYLVPPALSVLSAAHPEISFNICPLSGTKGRQPDESGVPGTHFGTPEDAEVEITVSPSPETMDFEGEEKLVGVMDAVVVASPL